jgi:hypothetical protein
MHGSDARTAPPALRRPLGLRRLLAGLAAGGLLAASTAGAAHARVELVRWRQPNADAAEGFLVHLGSASQRYDDVVDVGPLTASSDGVYAVAVSVPDASTVYVAVSAYNGAGESGVSNESLRPAGEAEPPGEAPQAGHRPGPRPGRPASGPGRGAGRLGLSWDEDSELHASLDPRAVPNGGGLELRGRVRIDASGAGIGVTLRDPSLADAFYWLGRDPEPGAPFTVASTVSALECASELPVPEAGAWYRFRFAVLPGARRTRVAAKVWPEGTREPKRWARCDDGSAERLVAVVPGVWGVGTGAKAWDGVKVRGRRG